jgi:SEC-C motif domain protein
MSEEMLCPCHSGKMYSACCQEVHLGITKPLPEALMRSRYSAYALGLIDYLLETTHPTHPLFKNDPNKVREGMLDFSKNTLFEGLEILEALPPGEKEAFVTFRAILKQKGKDTSFTEKSLFLKEKGRWLYAKGV